MFQTSLIGPLGPRWMQEGSRSLLTHLRFEAPFRLFKINLLRSAQESPPWGVPVALYFLICEMGILILALADL